MTLEKLIDIFQRNNIPMDAILESDSGWECGPTYMDGVYYNQAENRIVFTQGYWNDDYCEPDWSLLHKAKYYRGKNINNYIYIDEDILLRTIYRHDSVEEEFKKELRRNNEFELYYGVKESEEKYEKISLDQPLFWSIYANKEEEGYYRDCIGYIGVTSSNDVFDIEIYIFKEFRRKGYAKRVLTKIIEYIKEKRIKVFDEEQQLVTPIVPDTIQAIVREENIASRALMESCGFNIPDGFLTMMVFSEDDSVEEGQSINCVKYIYD